MLAGVLSIQIHSEIGDKSHNINKVEQILQQYKDYKLDLVVLPEFFSTNTGYKESPEAECGGETMGGIKSLAKKYNTNIVAGTIVRRIGDRLFNTSFAINRSGEIVGKYDKIHLFSYMGGTEGDRITAGSEHVVVDFDFGRVGLAICFDLRYPLHFRQLAQMGAEIIVLPTAWLVPNEVYDDATMLANAREMWIAMNRTRAYDNMAYVVVSNQIGYSGDSGWAGIGQSMIISPTADVLVGNTNEEKAIYTEIDLSVVGMLRSYFPLIEQD